MEAEKIAPASLFLHEKPAKVLLNIKNVNKPRYASVISRDVETTYAHTINILQDLWGLGLVKFEHEGRIKLVKLTSRGKEVADALQSFLTSLKKTKGKKISKKGRRKKLTKVERKLEKYQNKLKEMYSELYDVNKLGKKDAAIKARVLGRYKSLIESIRPRTDKARKTKDRSIKLVKKIEKLLQKLRSQP